MVGRRWLEDRAERSADLPRAGPKEEVERGTQLREESVPAAEN